VDSQETVVNILRDFIEFLRVLVDWWFVVEPWERSVRVRLGKHLVAFGPGVHVKIPFVDQVYVQNIRRRVMTIGQQTLTTQDGSVITLNGSIGYQIIDVVKLHQTLHDAEATVLQHVQGVLARYVAAHNLVACSPALLMQIAKPQLDFEAFGLLCTDFFLSSFVANVRTIRLLNDTMGGWVGGSSLNTGSGNGGPVASPRRM
jgi:hypothetical protein